MSSVAAVVALPNCDICHFEDDTTTTAHFDGKTRRGPWAFMCGAHFVSDGVGLGTGYGQRLIVSSS